MTTMHAPVEVVSDDGLRVARCYPSGRATFRFEYSTTFGPNSAGFERTFMSQDDALTFAETWARNRS